jgi:hypothetical protein
MRRTAGLEVKRLITLRMKARNKSETNIAQDCPYKKIDLTRYGLVLLLNQLKVGSSGFGPGVSSFFGPNGMGMFLFHGATSWHKNIFLCPQRN